MLSDTFLTQLLQAIPLASVIIGRGERILAANSLILARSCQFPPGGATTSTTAVAAAPAAVDVAPPAV